MSPYFHLLRERARLASQAQIAREIGYSPAVVSQVLSGTYRGNLDAVAARVEAVYGHDGQVLCPILGVIDPAQCADTCERARRIGSRAGNPNTVRLYHACRHTCPVGGGRS